MRRSLRLLPFCALAALLLVPAALGHDGPHAFVDGTLRTWHGDTDTAPVGHGAGIDTAIAGVVELADLAPADAQKLAGRPVRGEGHRNGNVLAVGHGNVSATGGSTVAAVSCEKRVAVILFNFANAPTVQPWTHTTVRNVVFDGTMSVNRYYQDSSYGQLSLTGDVFGYYTIASGNTGCDWRTWGTQARNAAIAAGAPISTYQYVVYAFPSASGCGWAGLAYMPGSESWINNAMNLRVVGHELGHNLGTHHASTYACGTVVYAATGCSTSEYGDPFTVMGASSQRLHTAFSRAEYGHLTDTLTVTTSGAYTIAPVELSGSSPKQLRIARGNGTYLYLDFRQPWGSFDSYSATDPAVNGVQVRFNGGFNSYSQTKLLDAHPGGSFSDAAFGAGESWNDPVSGVTITVVSVSPAGAGVTVQFTPDTTPPSTPGNLAASPQSVSAIRLSWTASTDNSGGIAGYRIWRNGTQVAQVTGLSWTDTGLAASTTYAYEVRAFDASGNLSGAAAASATTPTPDTTPPTAPTGLLATVQKGRKVQLAWGASSDPGGAVAGYRVYRNGAQVTQVSTLGFRDHPGRGTFSYTVRAVDAAGNLSAASNTVTVTV